MSQSILFQQLDLAAQAADTLKQVEGRLTLTPSREPVQFATEIVTEAQGIVKVPNAAIVTPELKLIEANFYKQLHSTATLSNATEDDWMACIELSIAAPGATLGEINTDGEFVPAPFYEQLQVLREQTPMFYGQHMRCEPEAWNAFRQLLLDHGYKAIEIAQATPGVARSDRRQSVAHLGAPTRGAGNYGAQLPQRIKSGLKVDRAVLLANTDPERQGFKDPMAELFDNIKRAVLEGSSTDPDVKRNANRLVSSLTGITTWDNTEGRTMKAPKRAGLADVTVAGEPFNFWTVSGASAGAPASNGNGEANPFNG